MLNLPSLEEKQQTKEELKVANNQPGSLELELTSGIVIANNQPGSLELELTSGIVIANNQPGLLELEFTSDIVIANNQPGSLVRSNVLTFLHNVFDHSTQVKFEI
jgi:hypothetical protein